MRPGRFVPSHMWTLDTGGMIDSGVSAHLRDSRYMCMRAPFMSQGPGQLTVPGGATVFLFGEEDRDGMVMVIFDGEVR